MKRLLRIAIVSLAAAVVLLATFHYVRAQGTWPGNPAPKASSASQTSDPSRPHTLLWTYFTQAYYDEERDVEDLPYETGETYLALDSPTTIKCPFFPPGGCTLEIEQSVAVGGVDSTGNWWGPFVKVDGSFTSYSPPVGETPTDYSFVLATSNQSTTLTPGKHTVQSFVYSYDGLHVDSYHITYRVYAP